MKDGEIVKEGTPYEIFSDDELIFNSYLEKPLILEIYEMLCKNGDVDLKLHNNAPRNKEELFEILKTIN